MHDGDNTNLPQINYELLVEEALRTVVRSALQVAENDGLIGDSHFYITFLTDAPGVSIPKSLKAQHPERMTIVVQHQYWNLVVRDDDFSVTLSFSGQPESLTVPFDSVVDFNDPSVGFGLQFASEEMEPLGIEQAAQGSTKNEAAREHSADVVLLDSFRKNT